MNDKKFLLTLPAEQHQQLKVAAATQQTTMRELIAVGINHVIKSTQSHKPIQN